MFAREAEARQAVQALRGLGIAEQQVGMLSPRPGATQPGSPGADVSGLLALAAGAGDLGSVLTSMGVPDGEARFYAQEVAAGRTLVIVDSGAGADDARRTLLRHGGYDVQARGGDLARPEGAGVQGGTGARPQDVTGEWADVASRYEMLWAQHYGTTDQTWEIMEPFYRWAWTMANDPRLRGRPWPEVASTVERDWRASRRAGDWSLVEGPARDVWDDVAAEAAQGFEGGQDRRIPRQGSDQTVPTRDLLPPRA